MSLKFDSAEEFLNQLAIHVEKVSRGDRKSVEQQVVSAAKGLFRLGRVDPDYSEGRPSIIFSGESVKSGKQYPYLASYIPKGNDKVLLVSVGNSYVIIGKII